MKIAPKQAEAFVQRPDASCRAVLLYGPDSGLSRERANALKALILRGNDDPFALVELDEATLLADPARLADELGAISLLGGKRFICIRPAGDKLTKIIESALPALHADALLVLVADELGTRSALRALFEKEPALAALAAYKDEPRDVAELVRATLSQAGISAGRELLEYLAGQLGNDRFVTRQELAKIVTYVGDAKQLSLEEARELVDYNRDTNLDEVVNSVADRNLAHMDKAISQLLREATAPIAYLRAVQRYFNRLYAMRERIEAGESAEEVVDSARPPVFFRQKPVMARHLRSWRLPALARALALLAEAELAVKTTDLPPIAASSRKLMAVTQVK
jgi:DNA polymerase-3 subunit delta